MKQGWSMYLHEDKFEFDRSDSAEKFSGRITEN